jgi:hypothetical protein
MLRLTLAKNLCRWPELPFDLILLRTGQRGHFADVRFGSGRCGQAQPRLTSSSVLAGNPQPHRLGTLVLRVREIRYWGGRGHDAALGKRMPETRPRFDTVCTVFPEYPLRSERQRHLPNEDGVVERHHVVME